MSRQQFLGWTSLVLMLLSFVPLAAIDLFSSKESAAGTTLLIAFAGIVALMFAKQRPRAMQSDGSAEEAYLDRNLAVLALARALHDAGHRVGWRMRDEAYPILTMDLPTGQVSYHLPADEAAWADDLPDYPDLWDGHDLEEKRERVRRYLNTPTGGDS